MDAVLCKRALWQNCMRLPRRARPPSSSPSSGTCSRLNGRARLEQSLDGGGVAILGSPMNECGTRTCGTTSSCSPGMWRPCGPTWQRTSRRPPPAGSDFTAGADVSICVLFSCLCDVKQDGAHASTGAGGAHAAGSRLPCPPRAAGRLLPRRALRVEDPTGS